MPDLPPLPKMYAWLANEPGPKMLTKGLALLGTKEIAGPKSEQTILGWAGEVGLDKVYSNDDIPWCGLYIAICAKRAGWDYSPKGNALWARNWASWGNKSPGAALGDVIVFKRGSAGHVAMYVGEDAEAYHILGGNQSNAVTIMRKLKSEAIAVRRAPWRAAEPKNVRKIILKATGALSKNEA